MQVIQEKAKPESSNKNDYSSKKSAVYFGTAFFTALAIFAALNLSLIKADNKETRNPAEVLQQAEQEKAAGIPSRHSWAWWLAKLYQEEKETPDIVVFGSSLLGSAHATVDAQTEMKLVDVLTHRKMSFFEDQLAKRLGHKASIFSLGSPGEMISDAYLISKTLFTTTKKPKLVIATIAPRDFIDSTLPCPAATDHFKFYSNFVDLADLKSAAYPEFFSRMGAEIEKLPLKHLSKMSMSKHTEKAQSEWEEAESSRMEAGKSVVPAYALPKWVDNSKEYIERFKTPDSSTYNSELAFFRAWLKSMNDDGIAVMVVCMPTTEMNRKLLADKFWSKFRADINSSCKTFKADCFDLSDCELFKPTDYLDTVHLNVYGGFKLFPVIAERITLRPYYVNALSQKKETK